MAGSCSICGKALRFNNKRGCCPSCVTLPNCLDCNKKLKKTNSIRCHTCANIFKNKSPAILLKNSLAHKGKNNHFYGKKHTKEALEKISGSNHYLYIDGRAKKLRKWREEVLKRDNYTCQVCNKTKKQIKMDCHHIKNKKDYPTLQYEVDNGILLCSRCHKKYEAHPHFLLNLKGRK
jgi:hypothetical protein